MDEDALSEAIEKLDLVPVNGKIIVKEKEVRNYGKIIIPESTREMRATEGVVLAVADDVTEFIIGDEVYYGRYSGVVVNRGEKQEFTYYVMNAEDVIALIKEKE